jgi:hypothetical protein
MAVKKAAAKKAVVKKAPAKKTLAKAATKAGDAYACGVCGLAVTVDEACGCADACDIICCETPMKRKRGKK